MLKRSRNERILLLAVVLFIVPMVLSAAGNRESENGNGITLDQEVIFLLDQVESGELTLEEAKTQFLNLEKEFQVRTEERQMVMEMMEEVRDGEKRAADCADQLREQLKTRERIRERTQLKDETTAKDQTRSNTIDGSGDSSGGPGKK